MRPTIFAGLPWLVFLTIAYLLWGRRRLAELVKTTTERSGTANSQ